MRGEGPGSAPLLPADDPAADNALVSALVRGDREALGVLYDRHAGVLLALATRLLRDRHQAEELLHDVFLEAWHHAQEFDPARGTVRAWLVMRTRSRALDRRSARQRQGRLAEAAAQEPDTRAVTQADPASLDAGRVRQAVGQLPPELVAVLEMAYFDGRSFSEIAEALEIPLGTVKSRMARALALLREGMGLPSAVVTHRGKP